MVLLPPPYSPYQENQPPPFVTLTPKTLKAAARLHREWWRRMDLLPPIVAPWLYHLLWVLQQCDLPRVVVLKIVRSLRLYDLHSIRVQ